MILALAVIAIVVAFFWVFGRGMKTDAQAFRDGTLRKHETSEGNFSSDGDGE